MQFYTLALAALSSIASVQAQNVKTISVEVGKNGTVFSPNNIKAAVGDAVQFQFVGGNHTVTQSTFDQPCQPINNFNKNVSGVHTGFIPYAASAAMGQIPTYTIMINNTNPVWLYCAQAKHCQNGMVMVINEVSTSNRTLANYKAAAVSVAQTSFPGNAQGGSSGTGTTTGGDGQTTAPAGTAAGSMLSVPSTLSILGLIASVLLM